MSILYEKLKKYAVPAASVEDFRRRYTKPDRLTKRGPAYAAAVIQAAPRGLRPLRLYPDQPP